MTADHAQGGDESRPANWHVPCTRDDRIYNDDHVRNARDVVRLSGLADELDLVREQAGKSRAGRRNRDIPLEALLVAMLLSALDGGNMLCTRFAQIIQYRLSPEIRRELDITRRRPYVAPTDGTDDQKNRAHRDRLADEKQIERLIHACIDPLNPSPVPVGRVLPRAQVEELSKQAAAELGDQEMARRERNLLYIANRLLEATWLSLPQSTRSNWTGNLGVDTVPAKVRKGPLGTKDSGYRW